MSLDEFELSPLSTVLNDRYYMRLTIKFDVLNYVASLCCPKAAHGEDSPDFASIFDRSVSV